MFIPLSSRRERYYMYTVNTFEIPAPGQPHLYTYLNNDIAAAKELIVINAETLVNQCTTSKGTETTVEKGCHMCIKPKHCNCVYIAQSPLGSVTLAPDEEQCTTFSHKEKVKFPVNLAKMQYLWSEHYIKNLSEQVIEKVNEIPEAPFHIDDSQFEHALNRHYDFSIDLAKAAKKAKKNVKLYPIKRLPASTWQLDKVNEFFTLANTLSLIAILSTITIILCILTCRQLNKLAYKVYIMSISAQTTYVRAADKNETTILKDWVTVLKIDCQPSTLKQTARKGVSGVKLRGSTFNASMVMKWHNRTISHLTTNNVITPPIEVRLTV